MYYLFFVPALCAKHAICVLMTPLMAAASQSLASYTKSCSFAEALTNSFLFK